ncbi:WXG100 family type VII secretion target [Actinomycetospora atypica]|uniref:WXG100 family type VII secretion target n=1 Tax=Actinomycetospora atypica TaxID=1290095 RepID=A0ABV9YUS6_9PSEU
MARRDGGDRAALSAVPPPRRLADLGAASSDVVLAAGDRAIAAIAAVLPERTAVAARVGLPAPSVDAADLLARHCAQRGIRFAALADGAEDLRRAAERLRARHRALAEEAGVLWERWSGPSAEEVADRVVLLGRATQEVVTMLSETAETVEAAGLAVADDVAARAAAARALGAAEPGPAPGPGAVSAAARSWAATLDAELHRYLEVADRTDRSIAATWQELAQRLDALRRLSGAEPEPIGADPAGLPPDLLALPEILAALGPLGLDDEPDGPDDRPGDEDDVRG